MIDKEQEELNMSKDKNERDRLVRKNLDELREVEGELLVAKNMLSEMKDDKSQEKVERTKLMKRKLKESRYCSW